MKKLAVFAVFSLLLTACNNTAKKPPSPPDGELAFLLQYNGRLPADVGFLTNHVVERRLANMMKDSFMIFMGKTAFAKPIAVNDSFVIFDTFFADSMLQKPSAELVIDAQRDAFWSNYKQGDSTFIFSDHPSWPKPLLKTHS